MKKKMKIISSSTLKILAMFFMLLDHLWARIVPGNTWMTYMGRMAFPIFAFLIVEGYFHTSDFKKYAKRLLVFALISEIPFNLMYISSPIFPFHQNVMFTLLLGLLTIRSLDIFIKQKERKTRLLCVLKIFGIMVASIIGFVDYNIYGVLTVVAFYLCRFLPFEPLWQLLAMVLINGVLHEGEYIPIDILGHTFNFVTQSFAVGALIFIWMYNGKKGITSKIFQYGGYAFYPIHMLILFIVSSF